MLQPLTSKFSIVGSGVKTMKDIMKGYDDLGKKFRKTEKDQSKLWNRMGSGLKSFTSKLKSGTVAIGNGFRKIGDVAGGAFNKMKSAGGKAFKFLKRGALGVGAAITGALAVGMKTGIGKEGQRLTLETITGSKERAAELMKYGTKFANVTPFKTSEVSEAVTRLSAGGLDPQKTLQQVGDMSAIMGKSLMQGVEAIIDSQTGEFERLKEFSLTKDIVNKFGMSIGYGNLIDKKGSVTDIAKFNDVMFKLMQQKFGGGMKKLSTTTKGLWSTVVGVFSDGMSQIVGVSEDGTIKAGSALDTLKTDILKPLADQMIKWSSDGTFKEWGDQLTGAIKLIKPYFSDMKGTINGFKTAIIGIPDAFASLKKTLEPILAGVTAMFAASAVAMIAANPVLYAGLAAAAGTGYLGFKLYQGNEELQEQKSSDQFKDWGALKGVGFGSSENQAGYGTSMYAGAISNKGTTTVTSSPNIHIYADGKSHEEITEIVENAIDNKEQLDKILKGE